MKIKAEFARLLAPEFRRALQKYNAPVKPDQHGGRMAKSAKSHKVNWDDVQESRTIIKAQLVRAKITKAVENVSRAAQKYMPTVTFTIIKGSRDKAKIKGLNLVEFFTLGTDEDPKFLDPATRGPGIGNLKKLVKKSGARMVGDIKKQLELLVGKDIGLDVTEQTDDGSNDPKYKGKKRNQIADFFAIGERSLEASADEDEEEGEDSDTDEDEDSYEDSDSDSDDEDDDEDEDEDE